MQVTRDIDISSFAIQSYGPGEITLTVPRRLESGVEFGAAPGGEAAGEPATPPVRRVTLHRSVVIMPDRLITDWPPQRFEDLTQTHFDLLADQGIEIVLFGSGDRLRRPDPALLANLMQRGVGVEVMDTGAACRTYNILMADRRRVAAALLMI